MANKLSNVKQKNIFASMMLQIHTQSLQQELMQKELQTMKHKLEQTNKTLAQKDILIGSLETDLEHMIDQLAKIQHATHDNHWINRSCARIGTETVDQMSV